jgi:hypothetical protein
LDINLAAAGPAIGVEKLAKLTCLLLFMGLAWNNFGAFEGGDWLPNNPKRRLNFDLWI